MLSRLFTTLFFSVSSLCMAQPPTQLKNIQEMSYEDFSKIFENISDEEKENFKAHCSELKKYSNFTFKKVHPPKFLHKEQQINLPHNINPLNTFFKGHSTYSPEFASKRMLEAALNAGHMANTEYQEPLFENGILNYLFWLFSGLNPITGEYEQSNYPSEFSNQLIKKMTESSHFVEYYNMLFYVYYQLQQNKILKTIGCLLQKQFIRVEKLMELYMSTDDWDQEEKQELSDSIAFERTHFTLMQTVVSNWVKDVLSHVAKIMEASLNDKKIIDYQNHIFLANIDKLRPTFLDDPYWAQSLNFLNLYNIPISPFNKENLFIEKMKVCYDKYKIYKSKYLKEYLPKEALEKLKTFQINVNETSTHSARVRSGAIRGKYNTQNGD